MLAYPLGCLAAKVAPVSVYNLPAWMPGKLSGAAWTLNDGPFNVKEHALIVIMANVGVSQAYGLHLIVVGDLYYGRSFAFGFGFLLLLCSQLLGFGMAGFAHQFVVQPASMMWPEALSVAANLNAFHAHDDAFSGKISRLRLLCYVLMASTLYFWLPGKWTKTVLLYISAADMSQGFSFWLSVPFRGYAGSRLATRRSIHYLARILAWE